MSLHGKIKQMKRLAIFADFAQRKAACMFATDIAARGLDFPNVDWVVQVDCPDDVEGYIHRVGRSFSSWRCLGAVCRPIALPHTVCPVRRQNL